MLYNEASFLLPAIEGGPPGAVQILRMKRIAKDEATELEFWTGARNTFKNNPAWLALIENQVRSLSEGAPGE